MQTSKIKRNGYNPNLGFIGNTQVEVANYLFKTSKSPIGYQHAKPLVKMLLNRKVSELYKESKNLTKFLKTRDLTFSKQTANGEYKIFTVPCTSTVVPLQKSVFNQLEKSAQVLMIALRAVLQDIYGSKDLKSSNFVKSLPNEVRKVFIDAIESSAHYYKQLHHPNMKDYPFFDIVGLDLVLVEEYLNQAQNFESMIVNGKIQELPNLPFRILELNAGSPSGASNNMNMLEGIHTQNPEILRSMGKLMPNDHFKVLGETYKSLGETWTNRTDAVQILLPPGGMNGAAPEIHQLAAYSGLVYADPVQLFQDQEGYIRLRTITGKNPIVNAIYSRINTDSALFDPEKGIILRDADSGEPIYLRDTLKLGRDGKAPLIKDIKGNPIPLYSDYAIPGAVDAIINRKLYLGGLNRILDNKIILAALTTYAPKFFAEDIKKAGMSLDMPELVPPKTLPPTKESVKTIINNPDEWVVKSPNLSGGTGVYIMQTLPENKKAEVIEMIKKNPSGYAYQQLVRIARIPVAVQRKEGFRFANIAADMRIWVFFGAGEGVLPKMTHNALVRTAPVEKGKMSSIVNTSKGGGYAPFVIVDDTNDPNAVTADELVAPKKPVALQSDLPNFVAAQMVQISRLMERVINLVKTGEADAYELLGLSLGLKMQCKEVLSFLHPRAIESIYKIIDIVETKVSKIEVAKFYTQASNGQMQVVSLLQKHEGKNLPKNIRSLLDGMNILNNELIASGYSAEAKAHDKKIVKEVKKLILAKKVNQKAKAEVESLIKTLSSLTNLKFPHAKLSLRTCNIIEKLMVNFANISKQRLLESGRAEDFAKLFNVDIKHKELKFETLYLGEENNSRDSRIASQKEFMTGILLTETDYVSPELRAARAAWLEVMNQAKKMNTTSAKRFISRKRKAHFAKFPMLKRYQELINSNASDVDSLIEILPVLPYAKYNIEQFAHQQGIAVRDVFTSKLQSHRISILSTKQITSEHLSGQEHAGECFAKKQTKHGLFSESDIYIWVRKELDPFTLIYTAGHELIHYQQIKDNMKMESNAIRTSAMEQAKFLNFYGNFLGVSTRSLESLSTDIKIDRKPLYGFADKIVPYFTSPIIRELRSALNESSAKWDETLNKYGSLFGYMMPNSAQVRVKALQEILPALENAKNITFAKELGLELNMDEVRSALPSATENQISLNTETIKKAVKTAKVDFEALRVIGNHQYHGVTFPKAIDAKLNLTLKPVLAPISLGNSYNQTQQQQQ